MTLLIVGAVVFTLVFCFILFSDDGVPPSDEEF